MTKRVDLHTHSYYSDGTMSPREILEQAGEKGIGLLAIADHERLGGTKELLSLAEYSDIKCISGIELSAEAFDMAFHILGYGFDVNDEAFNQFANRNEEMLESVNIKLIEKIEKEYDNISLEDYRAYEYDRTKGGWKALHYFIDRGITETVLEGMQLFGKYEHSYTCVSFPSVQEVCNAIHKAGGKAVLAHPGKVIRTTDMDEFEQKLREVLALGLDGMECYYPVHSEELTNICLKVCNEKNLLITCGSDCHGDFLNIEMGQLEVGVDQLNLKGLY